MTGDGGAGRIDTIAVLLAGSVTLALVVLLARVGQLQMAPAPQLREHVDARISGSTVLASRGDVLDRRGRVLTSTRFGYRVIVDPVRFPDPPDEAIVELASALGFGPAEVGDRVVSRLIENDRRRRAMAPDADGRGHARSDPQRTLVEAVRERLGLDRDESVYAREADGGSRRPRPLIRYLPIGDPVDLATAERVRRLRIPGVHLERRPVREYPGGETVASLVGKVGYEERGLQLRGLLGAELMLQPRLPGEDGRLRYVRDAWGRPLWVERGEWDDGRRGEDVRLSIDLELQRIAVSELQRGMEDADAAGGRLVMVDPQTGEILAMVDLMREVEDAVQYPWINRETGEPEGGQTPDRRGHTRYITLRPDPARLVDPALGRNRCVEDVYEPGSTFKTFVWAVAKERGLLPDEEVLRSETNLYRTPYGRTLRDVTFRREMTWDDVLVYSSNIGMAQASERLTEAQMREAVARFGFGTRTNIGLPGESPGIVTSARNWNRFSQTSVAIGHEIAVTPLQMVRAFCAFARDGELAGTLPRLRLTAFEGPDGTDPVIVERVLAPGVAKRAREVLAGVVDRLDARMAVRFPGEPRPRYTMFGKSGTAEIPLTPPPGRVRPRGTRGYFDGQYNSSFLAAGPVESPRLVVLVVIDDPGPSRIRTREHYGSAVAGPVVRRVMERSLRYLQVPPSGEPELIFGG